MNLIRRAIALVPSREPTNAKRTARMGLPRVVRADRDGDLAVAVTKITASTSNIA